MKTSPLSEQVDQLIKTNGAARSETAVCTTWILLTEWVGGDGSVWLEEHRTSDLPAWRRTGILSHVLSTEDDYEWVDEDDE